jgi:hypothetical protein
VKGETAQGMSEMDTAFDEMVIEEKRVDVEHDVSRSGGALDDEAFKGREMELANELLLVALGLGQHRAEDGSTLLFEQEDIFGETDKASSSRTNAEEHKRAVEDLKKEEPQTATTTFSQFGSRMWDTASSSIGKASKDLSGLAKGNSTIQEAKGEAPLKPNEPCHYDSRARAIIFVAITSMGVKVIDITMAEKVIAQSIYFILSEARSESKKQGKGDPLEENGRQTFMNSSSQGAVAKKKSEGKWARYAAAGVGITLGGVVIGLSGTYTFLTTVLIELTFHSSTRRSNGSITCPRIDWSQLQLRLPCHYRRNHCNVQSIWSCWSDFGRLQGPSSFARYRIFRVSAS